MKISNPIKSMYDEYLKFSEYLRVNGQIEQIRYLKEIAIGKTDSRSDFVSLKEFSPYYYEKKNSQFEFLKKSDKQYRFVMRGDSITDHGEWNELLGREDVINRGIGGDTTYGVLKRIANLNPSLKKAWVSSRISQQNCDRIPIKQRTIV